MDKKHKGAHAELIACAWLLREGYEVFRNVSQHGIMDIVAFKEGKEYRFDVKNTSLESPALLPSQVDAGVALLSVDKDGECTIYFHPRRRGKSTIICVQCERSFEANRAHLRKFCSNKCRKRWETITAAKNRIEMRSTGLGS